MDVAGYILGTMISLLQTRILRRESGWLGHVLLLSKVGQLSCDHAKKSKLSQMKERRSRETGVLKLSLTD